MAASGGLKAKKCVEIGFADQKFVFGSFDSNRNELRLDFGGAFDGIRDIDSRPPCEIFDTGRSFGFEILCRKLSTRFFHPQVERIGFRQQNRGEHK